MTAQQPPTDEPPARDRLSGPAASVSSSGSPSLLWMLIAVVTTLTVLGVLASQCTPANTDAPVVTSVPAGSGG